MDFSAENLNLSSTELTERLNETLAKCKEELHKVEEIGKGQKHDMYICRCVYAYTYKYIFMHIWNAMFIH